MGGLIEDYIMWHVIFVGVEARTELRRGWQLRMDMADPPRLHLQQSQRQEQCKTTYQLPLPEAGFTLHPRRGQALLLIQYGCFLDVADVHKLASPLPPSFRHPQ